MPRSRYNHRTLNIKGELLDKLIMAHLSKAPTTRAAVARKCNVSKTTAGKVANALLECGFVTQKLYSQSCERPALHLSLRDTISVLVLDLSRPRYTMRIVSTRGECLFSEHYDFDAELSYEDNLTIFLSRCGYEAKLKGIRFDAICAVYSGAPDRESGVSCNRRAYLPTATDKDKTLRIISSVFGRRCSVYVSLSEILCAAMELGIIPRDINRPDASYLFVGTHLEAFSTLGDKVTYCDADSLLLDSCSVGTAMQKRLTQTELETVLARLINMMSCAFCPGTIILESDIYRIDEDTQSNVSKRLAESGILCPALVATPSITLEVASRLATAALIRHYISACDDQSK